MEMMNFFVFVVTNLCSLILLCLPRYQTKKKRNEKTSSCEVLEMDSHASIPQAPLPQELVQTPNQAQVIMPKIGDCDVPHYDGLSYGIHPPHIEAHDYEIKASLIRLIQSSMFLGNGLENPYDHLDYFERLCGTFRIGGVPEDSIKLILFPFSLGEKARKWERALPSHLVKSWDDCKRVFLSRFYPTQRTHQMRSSILSFKQGSHETFHDAWERLRGYTRDCPHHGFTMEAILSSFYWGVAKEHKWTLDVASKGSFLNLTIEQGELLIENVAKSSESYKEIHDRTPNEETSEDFKWTALQAKLDRIEKLLIVQQRGVCSDHEQHQDDVNSVVNNGNPSQESMLLQPTSQENHEHIGSAKRLEAGTATRANLGTTRKMERPQTIPHDQFPNTGRLIPLRFKDGKIEYKVKDMGKSKPFTSAKSVISPSLLGDPSQVQETG